jgi:hypothetical protein
VKGINGYYRQFDLWGFSLVGRERGFLEVMLGGYEWVGSS